MTEFHEILYCSTLAPDQPTTTVSKIVARARTRNAERQITGLLVFDGLHFCQHIEGPPDAVIRLMDTIEGDARHEQVRVLYEGPLAQRRYRSFNMGFVAIEDADEMAGLRLLDGDAALARFLALLPRFDVNA